MPVSYPNPGPFRNQQRLSDLIGPYSGTYRIVYRVLQPLLVATCCNKGSGFGFGPVFHRAEGEGPMLFRGRGGHVDVL